MIRQAPFRLFREKFFLHDPNWAAEKEWFFKGTNKARAHLRVV